LAAAAFKCAMRSRIKAEAPLWQKQLQPFDGELSRIRNAAGIEPQNAEGQRRIDGTLQSPVYASTAKADCPLRNKPRSYTGPKDRSKSSTSSAGPR
jgi:hypothetical protein